MNPPIINFYLSLCEEKGREDINVFIAI